MKKILLIACVAIMAVSASAQKLALKGNLIPAEQRQKRLVAKEFAKTFKVSTDLKFRDHSAAKAAFAKKAPAQSDLPGDYNCEQTDYANGGQISVKTNSPVTIFEAEEEGVKYVCIHGLLSEGENEGIYGTYDPETGVITCGHQVVFTDDTYGRVAVCGIVDDATSDDLSFTVDEDGFISIDQEGWYAYLPDYTPQGEGDNNVWTLGWDTYLAPINGTVYYEYYSGGKWYNAADQAYVEDFETMVNVYNYFGGTVSMTVNDDLTVTLPMKQNIGVMYSGADKSVYGYTYYLIGMNQEEGTRDWTMESITGTLNGNTILFPGYSSYGGDKDDDGATYGGFFYDVAIQLNDGNFLADPTGVKEVKATLEDRIKNTKTYNLLGQQVDRSKATGLLIRGGKKYIKKF